MSHAEHLPGSIQALRAELDARIAQLETKCAAYETQIAALKVDLAAMQKERDFERERANEWLAQKHDTEKARDAALANLSQARAKMELLQSDVDEHLPDYVLDDGTDEPANHRERIEYAGDELRRLTTAHAATKAAFDDATADLCRVADERDEATANVAKLTARVHELQDMCIAKEGEVRAAREEVARLRSDHAEAAAAFNQSIADASVESDSLRTAPGQAVAALQEARDGICEIYRLIDADLEIKAMKACKPLCDKIDEALADADSAAAGEAWRELVAVYEEAKRFIDRTAEIDDKLPAYGFVVMGIPLAKAVAKVDARRGGGHYCKESTCKICRHGKPAAEAHARKGGR